jgi:hypothetical protein
MSSVQPPQDTHNGKRMLRNHPGPGDPDEQTPYSSYLCSEVLHTLQMPLSDSPAEPAFMVNAQVMELYFGLIVHEVRTAQDRGGARPATVQCPAVVDVPLDGVPTGEQVDRRARLPRGHPDPPA